MKNKLTIIILFVCTILYGCGNSQRSSNKAFSEESDDVVTSVSEDLSDGKEKTISDESLETSNIVQKSQHLTPIEVSLKIDKKETLTVEDYDVILSYMEDYYSEFFKLIDSYKGDEDKMLEQSKRKNEQLSDEYPYIKQFADALQRSYGTLTHEQEIRFKQLADKCDRYSNKLHR